MISRTSPFVSVSSLVLVAWLPISAQAQLVETLPEVRVTASASGEGAGEGNLDETVLSLEDLARFGVENLEDLSALAPNLHFVDSDTRGYGSMISMRGLSNTLFFGPAAVGLYIDDVPFSDAFTYNSNLLSFASARIHHGPQGVSFGANAPGGMINLTTLQAGDTFEGSASLEYGSYNTRGIKLSSSGPLPAFESGFLAGQELSHTFQFYWKERDGFLRNRTLGIRPDDRSVIGGVGSLIWKANQDTEVKLRVMAEVVDDGGQRLTALPESLDRQTGGTGPNPAYTGDLFQVDSDLAGTGESERYQLSLHVTKDLGWATAKSISSYQNWELGPQVVDLDFTNSDPFPLFASTSNISQRQTLRTKEFRLQSPEGAGPLAWRGGLFYMRKENTGNTVRQYPVPAPVPFGFVPFTQRLNFNVAQESFAAYGKLNYELGNGFAVDAGARVELVEVSLDRSNEVPPQSLSENRDELYFSPTAGASYEVSENVTAFVRSGLGIKPHGYSAFSDDINTARFEEEKNWSNEAGIQFRNEPNKVNAVVRAYWNKVEDYHLNAQNPFSTDFVVANAEEVRSRGVEAELQWRPTDPLLIHANAGYSDVHFEDYTDIFTGIDSAGNTVPFIPEFTASVGFRYDLPGGFFVGSSVRGTRKTYYDAANTEAFSEDGYLVWDAQVGYEQENWSVTLYGRNLLEEDYYTYMNPSIAAGTPGDPQLFGVRVDLDIW